MKWLNFRKAKKIGTGTGGKNLTNFIGNSVPVCMSFQHAVIQLSEAQAKQNFITKKVHTYTLLKKLFPSVKM